MAKTNPPQASPFPSGSGFPGSMGSANGGSGKSPFPPPGGMQSGLWQRPPQQPPSGSSKYGWHVLQTIIVLVVTVGVAVLCGFLKETLSPSALTDMLCYSLPAIAALVTALLVENVTNAMTPRFSRRAQVLATLIASALVIVISLVSSIFYQQTFLPKLPAEADLPTPTPTVEPVRQQIVLLLDKSSSMTNTDLNQVSLDQKTVQAVRQLLGEMSDDTQVGLVIFSHEILGTQPVKPLDAAQRQAIENSSAMDPTGLTDIGLALETALDLVDSDPALKQETTQFLLLTDGSSLEPYASDLYARMQASNVKLYCIEMNYAIDDEVKELVQQTGGSFVELDNVDDLLESAVEMIQATPEPTAVPEPPAPEPYHLISESPVLWLVLLLLRGIIIGVTLSLMLSVLNQFRFQVILSPLCALVIWFVPTLVALSFPFDAMLDGLCGLVIMRRNQPR